MKTFKELLSEQAKYVIGSNYTLKGTNKSGDYVIPSVVYVGKSGNGTTHFKKGERNCSIDCNGNLTAGSGAKTKRYAIDAYAELEQPITKG